ncbi:MAG: hypothetical protein U1A22_08980 [Xanthomonadaceae bacterium]|nr:hypothetical protein [Xanthomonadaceae bacterium]
MKQNTFKSMLIALSLAAAPVAIAQVPAFEDLDADGSGLIDRTEASNLPCLHANFDVIGKADPNGIGPDEFSQALNDFCSNL